jgi:hypothetical protein
MAIGSVVQRGTYVYAKDDRGRELCQLPAGNGPRDGLVGYTSTTISIRRGNNIYTYSERGRNIGERPA